jgi:pyruvate dehydrogenase E1 component alpha subunit
MTSPGDVTRLQALYLTMARIRAFEDAAEAASQGGVQAFGQSASAKPALVRGPLHLSTGQEAVAAAVCAHLRRDDLLTSTHRGHGHTLAKGADVTAMMCELYGRANGTNKGKGGSMHIADFGVGMLGANGVVAAGIPIAAGAAHALKLRGTDAIVACFFGDGAVNRGPFLEGLNWARVYGLPVLFVCEDNRISATTPTGPMTAGAGTSVRAQSMDVPSEVVDGNDVLALDAAAARLVAEVRAGQGPRLLHAATPPPTATRPRWPGRARPTRCCGRGRSCWPGASRLPRSTPSLPGRARRSPPPRRPPRPRPGQPSTKPTKT